MKYMHSLEANKSKKEWHNTKIPFDQDCGNAL